VKFHPRPVRSRRGRAVGHGLLIFRSLLEILVVTIFVSTFIAEPAHVPTASMSPTIRPGDLLLADNQSFAPEGIFGRLLPPTTIRRGELAIFHRPGTPHTTLVKRVVGLPGDRIHLRDGRPIVNGVALAEPWAVYAVSPPNLFRDDFPSLGNLDPDVDPAWWSTLRHLSAGGDITVPPGNLFVLGDNRNNSVDSRYWGFVPINQLIGSPLLVYLPAQDGTASRNTFPERLKAFLHGIRILQ
jgi:signal peptidase I